MAYAVYSRGLACLYGLTRDPRHLIGALAARDRLLELSETFAWGLPFGSRGLPANQPYAVTTALAGSAFLELLRIDPTDRVSALALEQTCRWLTRELPWTTQVTGAAPWYSPGFSAVTINVAALVGGLLAEASEFIVDEVFERRTDAALSYVRSTQHPFGMWPYGESDPISIEGFPWAAVVDSVHTGYTLEGLLAQLTRRCVTGSPTHDGLVESIVVGFRFLKTFLIDDAGRLNEKVVIAAASDPRTRTLLGRRALHRYFVERDRWLVKVPGEARTWSYGAVLRSCARASELGVFDVATALELFARLHRTQLASASGRFGYRSDDGRVFPRHEAHLFDGVCALLAALESRKTLTLRPAETAIEQLAL